ncbi:MAG: hypothetical protein ACFCUU_00175 [Cyclobacteriaceae bacterium]
MKRLLLWLPVIVMSACGGSKKADEKALIAKLDSLSLEQPVISKEVMTDIIQLIPSPLEISYMLKNSGVKYDFDMLNNPNNTSKYNSAFEKALNLGIYGTDLGYANIYEQNQDALFYLNSIKGLADELSIGQFFDFGTIKRLAVNSRNLDSLLLITTQNFNSINSYLQENQRANLSVLILTGGWLEALHITCQVASKDPDNLELMEKIGEQKIILDNIKLLLGFYISDPFIADLHKEILELEKSFAKIEIIYKYAEPTFEEVNGMLVIKDNSSTTTNITIENVQEIRRGVSAIRGKVIS